MSECYENDTMKQFACSIQSSESNLWFPTGGSQIMPNLSQPSPTVSLAYRQKNSLWLGELSSAKYWMEHTDIVEILW